MTHQDKRKPMLVGSTNGDAGESEHDGQDMSMEIPGSFDRW